MASLQTQLHNCLIFLLQTGFVVNFVVGRIESCVLVVSSSGLMQWRRFQSDAQFFKLSSKVIRILLVLNTSIDDTVKFV